MISSSTQTPNPVLQRAMYDQMARLLTQRESKHRAGGRQGLVGQAARAFRRRQAAKQDRRRRIAEASRRLNRRKGARS